MSGETKQFPDSNLNKNDFDIPRTKIEGVGQVGSWMCSPGVRGFYVAEIFRLLWRYDLVTHSPRGK